LALAACSLSIRRFSLSALCFPPACAARAFPAFSCDAPASSTIDPRLTVFLDGLALNKPRDAAEARAMLRRLSGRAHTVFTGLALRQAATGLRVDEHAASEVFFRPLDEMAIEAYLAKVHTLDKAGGYAIQ
jgi:septum formation protein